MPYHLQVWMIWLKWTKFTTLLENERCFVSIRYRSGSSWVWQWESHCHGLCESTCKTTQSLNCLFLSQKQKGANECPHCSSTVGFLTNRALSLWRPRSQLSVAKDSSRDSQRAMAIEKDLMPTLQWNVQKA